MYRAVNFLELLYLEKPKIMHLVPQLFSFDLEKGRPGAKLEAHLGTLTLYSFVMREISKREAD